MSNNNNENTEQSAFRSHPDSEQISDPVKVAKLLQRFTKHYTPLTVHVPSNSEHFTSCIIGVEGKHVLLDELIPATGHKLLVDEQALYIKGKLDGIDIQFFTTLQRVGEKDNLLTYYMALPEKVEYRQRRLSYRAPIPIRMSLPVFIEDKHSKVIKGALHNLSYGGAGMIFLPDKTIIEAGTHHECAIELPEGDWIYCTVELRYTKNIPSRKTQYIGAQFIGLLPMQSRLIGRCISKLERDFIRKN